MAEKVNLAAMGLKTLVSVVAGFFITRTIFNRQGGDTVIDNNNNADTSGGGSTKVVFSGAFPIIFGKSSDSVKNLQIQLNKALAVFNINNPSKAVYPLMPDGVYGKFTAGAVKAITNATYNTISENQLFTILQTVDAAAKQAIKPLSSHWIKLKEVKALGPISNYIQWVPTHFSGFTNPASLANMMAYKFGFKASPNKWTFAPGEIVGSIIGFNDTKMQVYVALTVRSAKKSNSASYNRAVAQKSFNRDVIIVPAHLVKYA